MWRSAFSLQTQSPSWLYPITVGATTIWERWDSLLADGTINANGMTSFNHYALGSVVDWVHRRIAGLAPAAPGYRTISVRPIFPTALDHCTARHRTPYGDAAVSWSRANGVITLEVEVPVGACAEVELADSEVRSVGHGRHRWQIVEQPAATRPIVTVRDFVDSADAWEQLTRFAVDNALASSDTHLAQLLVPFRDRPVAEIADAVWTRIWPAESTKRALAGLVANIMIAPAVPVRPLQAPLADASSHV